MDQIWSRQTLSRSSPGSGSGHGPNYVTVYYCNNTIGSDRLRSEPWGKMSVVIKRWFNPLLPTSQSTQSCLIILNTPISNLNPDHFLKLWSQSHLKICADGGANRLFDFASETHSTELWPDYIKGDLDSIREDVRSYYSDPSKPTQVIEDQSQDSTDLGKCLDLLESLELHSEAPYRLIIHGGLNGRLDQTLHTLHTLLILELGQEEPLIEGYRHQKSRRLTGGSWVIDTFAGSMACALEAGYCHQIYISSKWKLESELTCGILPIGVNEAIVTSRGLRWDLGQSLYLS